MGNGVHPVQFLMTVVSMGLAVVLLVSAFRYADRAVPRLTERAVLRPLHPVVLVQPGAGRPPT